MAYGYWKTGLSRTEVVFHLFYRSNPFNGGYSIVFGLADAIEYVRQFRFNRSDIEYLETLHGNDGQPLFAADLLADLERFEFFCDIDAMPEGTVAFAIEPVLRIAGPIIECQILETVLLNILNFQTLIATKASRVCHATRGDPVFEFGLRRAQGHDGALSASRVAYIGGCAATSNVLAGKRYGIPVSGTHAHSWIMCL